MAPPLFAGSFPNRLKDEGLAVVEVGGGDGKHHHRTHGVHREWQPGKTDAGGFTMASMRERICDRMN